MVYRTTNRTLERKARRRRAFLDEATRLFGRDGFHAVTVPMIVQQTKTSTGTFYLYFRDKEDLFAAALEDIGEQISAALNQAVAAAEPDIFSHMKAAIEGLVGFLVAHPHEARVLIVESSGLGKRLDDVRRAIVESHTRGVSKALQALSGRIPTGLNVDVAANCWVGAVYEAVFAWLRTPTRLRPAADSLARAIVSFNLRAVGAPEKYWT
jgi:AcrR family transcriptional regulator